MKKEVEAWFLVLAWGGYLGFGAPFLISAANTELVVFGVVLGLILARYTYRFLKEKCNESN